MKETLWTNGKGPPEATKNSTVLTRGGAERRTKFDHFDGPGGPAGPKKIDGNLTGFWFDGAGGRGGPWTHVSFDLLPPYAASSAPIPNGGRSKAEVRTPSVRNGRWKLEVRTPSVRESGKFKIRIHRFKKFET